MTANLFTRDEFENVVENLLQSNENSEPKEFSEIMMKYVVKCLGSSFEFADNPITIPELATTICNEDCAENDENDVINFRKLVVRITTDSKSIGTTFRWIIDTIELLHLIGNQATDEDLELKACYMVSAFTLPILKLYTQVENGELELEGIVHEDEESPIATLKKEIKDILTLIPKSFCYNQYGDKIGLELTLVMEQYSDILIRNGAFLHLYKEFFEYDSQPLLKIGLNSLSNLCEKPTLRQKLVEFFTLRSNEMMKIIYSIYINKNCDEETLKLLYQINDLMDTADVWNDSQKEQIYTSIISDNENVSIYALSLMLSYENDSFLHKVTDIIYKYLKKVNKITNVVSNIVEIGYKFTFDKLFDMIKVNTNNDLKTSIAARIYFEVSNRKLIEDGVIRFIDIWDSPEVSDAKCVLIGFWLNYLLKTIDVQEFKDNGQIRSITEGLVHGFVKIDSFFEVEKIIKLLNIITQMSGLEDEKAYFEDFFSKWIGDILPDLQLYIASAYAEKSLNAEVLMKLACIFNEMHFVSLNTKVLKFLLDVTLKYWQLDGIDKHERHFQYMIRLQANLFKYIWQVWTSDEPNVIENIDERAVVVNILRFINMLNRYISTGDYNFDLFTAMHIAVSVLELLCMFQPGVFEIHNNPVFKIAKYNLNEASIVNLTEFLHHFIYEVSNDNLSSDCKQIMLNEWLQFNKNYFLLNSKIASSKFLRHYHAHCKFKHIYEMLMDCLYKNDPKHKKVFCETIADVIAKFSEFGDEDDFKKFATSFEDYLAQNMTEKDKNETIINITKNVYKYLNGKLHKEPLNRSTNRLTVLDYLAHFVSHKWNRQTLLQIINVSQINAAELATMEKFINQN